MRQHPSKTSWVAVFLVRAAQAGRNHQVITNMSKYTALHSFFAEDGTMLSPAHLLDLQDHIVELCRSDVQTRIDELRAQKHLLPEFSYSMRKEHILVKMKRLIPGNTSSSIAGVWDESSKQVLTEASDIANILNEYWQKVFNAKPVDKDLLETWLSRVDSPLPFSGLPAEYVPSLDDVYETMKTSHDSSPGPDGIPFKAWKVLRNMCAPIFHRVLCKLFSTSPEELRSKAPHFNEAFLCCLGKRPMANAIGGQVFTPSSTRPLSVVNADNRILASTLRLKVAPLLESWVSTAQRGFIKGRHLLNNVVDIDWQAMRVSLRSQRGAIMLFDFGAAFPSLSHEYLWRTLASLGSLPP